MLTVLLEWLDHHPDISDADHETIRASIGQPMVGFSLATTDHQYYISKKGRQGLVPLGTLESDILCIITGCSTPIVFRPVEGYYILDGEAYVQGSMAREAFKDAIDNEIKPKVFEIR